MSRVDFRLAAPVILWSFVVMSPIHRRLSLRILDHRPQSIHGTLEVSEDTQQLMRGCGSLIALTYVPRTDPLGAIVLTVLVAPLAAVP